MSLKQLIPMPAQREACFMVLWDMGTSFPQEKKNKAAVYHSYWPVICQCNVSLFHFQPFYLY